MLILAKRCDATTGTDPLLEPVRARLVQSKVQPPNTASRRATRETTTLRAKSLNPPNLGRFKLIATAAATTAATARCHAVSETTEAANPRPRGSKKAQKATKTHKLGTANTKDIADAFARPQAPEEATRASSARRLSRVSLLNLPRTTSLVSLRL